MLNAWLSDAIVRFSTVILVGCLLLLPYSFGIVTKRPVWGTWAVRGYTPTSRQRLPHLPRSGCVQGQRHRSQDREFGVNALRVALVLQPACVHLCTGRVQRQNLSEVRQTSDAQGGRGGLIPAAGPWSAPAGPLDSGTKLSSSLGMAGGRGPGDPRHHGGWSCTWCCGSPRVPASFPRSLRKDLPLCTRRGKKMRASAHACALHLMDPTVQGG